MPCPTLPRPQAFSADTHTRSMLAMHQPLGVDFRASCFCHKRTIDTGFVCSVCLSIFCQQVRWGAANACMGSWALKTTVLLQCCFGGARGSCVLRVPFHLLAAGAGVLGSRYLCGLLGLHKHCGLMASCSVSLILTWP